jgi:amino acid transporter, AAT family
LGRKNVSDIGARCPKTLRNEAYSTNSAPARWLWSPSAGQSAAALEIAGPGVILSFVLAALISLTITLALGELSSMHPAAGSFGVYGDLYLNRWAGFIARAGYWVAISISIGAELVASATYLDYWFPSVPALFWVVIFSVLLLLINLRSVGNYARFEYWFAMIKVATIAAFIVLGAGLLLSGRVTPEYTAHGGFFPKGPLALHLRRAGICRHHDW